MLFCIKHSSCALLLWLCNSECNSCRTELYYPLMYITFNVLYFHSSSHLLLRICRNLHLILANAMYTVLIIVILRHAPAGTIIEIVLGCAHALYIPHACIYLHWLLLSQTIPIVHYIIGWPDGLIPWPARLHIYLRCFIYFICAYIHHLQHEILGRICTSQQRCNN